MIEVVRLCLFVCLFAGKNEAVSGSITADNEYFYRSSLVEQAGGRRFLDISGMELLAGSERDIGFSKRSIKEKLV